MEQNLTRAAAMAEEARRLGIPLATRVGQDVSPRTAQMSQMLAAQVAGQPGVGCGPVTGQACAPMNYPQQVLNSVMAKQCDPQYQLPGLTPEQSAAVVALINTSKYASSPARLGWQCDSLTFTTWVSGVGIPNIAANAAFGPINVTPTKSFAMDSLVSAAGTSNDPVFFMESLSYDGYNYIDNAPWLSTLYTSQSACCLCVRDVKIIQQGTTASLSGHNGATANVLILATAFGSTLFGGNP